MTPTKLISGFLALLFVYFIVVQYNDPDPGIWMPIYGLAVIASLSVFVGRAPNKYVFVVMAVVYFIGAIRQWPPAYEGIFFGEMEMRSLNIELARESLGLAIAGIGMLVLAWLRPATYSVR